MINLSNLLEELHQPSFSCTTSTDSSDLKSIAASKAPFSYFFQVKMALDTASDTAATSSITWSDWITGLIGTDTTDNIKTTLTIIIWLLFGFWLFERTRHFEL